jgi:hypothetical protein
MERRMNTQIDKLEPMKKIFVAATPNELVNTPTEKGTVAGFWHGLWHGFIFPIAFFMSLFNKRIGLYESHNNGGWYNFGFLLGLSMSLGGKTVNVKVNGRK